MRFINTKIKIESPAPRVQRMQTEGTSSKRGKQMLLSVPHNRKRVGKENSMVSHGSFLSSSDINSPNKLANFSNRHSDGEDEDSKERTLGNFQKLPAGIKNQLHENFVRQYPANPLLPKTFMKLEDSPKFGGLTKFIKLMKFKGQDDGKSKFRQEAMKIEHIEFPEGTTIQTIFRVIKKKQQVTQINSDTGPATRIQTSIKNNQKPDTNFTQSVTDIQEQIKINQNLQMPQTLTISKAGGMHSPTRSFRQAQQNSPIKRKEN